MSTHWPDRDIIYLYEKKGEISLWTRNKSLWFRFHPKTPKSYADAMAKMLKTKPDYSSCWWGQGENSPDKQKFKFLYKFRAMDVI